MKYLNSLWLIIIILSLQSVKASEVTDTMLKQYQELLDSPFSEEAGEALWMSNINGRSCTNCHTHSVKQQGKHQRTGKLIEAMAPSVNFERLTQSKKINKWFLRNCKWTFGRECTVKEKADILYWLSKQ